MLLKKILFVTCIGLTVNCSPHENNSYYFTLGQTCLEASPEKQAPIVRAMSKTLGILFSQEPSSKRSQQAFRDLKFFLKGVHASIGDNAASDNQWLFLQGPLGHVIETNTLEEALRMLGSSLIEDVQAHSSSYSNDSYSRGLTQWLTSDTISPQSPAFRGGQDIATTFLDDLFALDLESLETSTLYSLRHSLFIKSLKKAMVLRDELFPESFEEEQSDSQTPQAFAGFKEGINRYPVSAKLKSIPNRFHALVFTFIYKMIQQLLTIPDAAEKNELPKTFSQIGKELVAFSDGLSGYYKKARTRTHSEFEAKTPDQKG